MFVSDLWSLARIPERYPRKGDRVTATAVTPEKRVPLNNTTKILLLSS